MHHIRSDVAIVGAGAVGIYLASRLAAKGLLVDLIDVDSDGASSLQEGVDAGGHSGSRYGVAYGFGGTTALWGGQLWPWEPAEFAFDDNGRSWPRAVASQVLGNYNDVLSHLGLSRAHREIHEGVLAKRQGDGGLTRGRVRYSSWMDPRQRNFAVNRRLQPDRWAVAVRILKATHVEQDQSGWIIRGSSPSDTDALRTRNVVLAAGTLGNFRLLASSELGATLTSLGSGFADHISAPVAQFAISSPHLFRRRAAHALHRGVLGSPRLVPSEMAEMPGYGHWQVVQPEWLPINEAKLALASRRMPREQLARFRGHGAELAGALVGGWTTRSRPVLAGSKVVLRVDVQQSMAGGNRLEFDDERKVVKVAWEVDARSRESIRRHGARLLQDLDLGSLGLRLLSVPELRPHDIFHLMGGTAIGSVVDENLNVVGVPGLFVVGASVFPTGGMANPTLTALALAEQIVRNLS